jgi:hypothetical protein
MEKTIIIELGKDDKFVRYHYSARMSDGEATEKAMSGNKEAAYQRYRIIEDAQIIQAILATETKESMKRYAKEIDDALREVTNDIEYKLRDLKALGESIKTYVEEKAGAN